MAGTFIAAARAGDGQSSTTDPLSITIPAGASSGDQAVLIVDLEGTSITLTTPSGWTLVDDDTGSGNSHVFIFTKTLAGGEPGSNVSLDYSSAARSCAVMAVWSGLNIGSISVGSPGVDSSAVNSYPIPSRTAAAHDTIIAAVVRRRSGAAGNITMPSPYTTPTNGVAGTSFGSGANVFLELGYVDDVSAGSVGGETATTGTTSIGYTYLILVPATASTQNLDPTAIASAQSLGAPTISTTITSSPDAISTAASLGAPDLTTTVTSAPTAITTGESLGSPVLSMTITVEPGAIASEEALGEPTITSGTGQLAPDAIASLESLGEPSVSISIGVVIEDGIPSEEALGVPAAVTILYLEPTTVTTAEGLGEPSVGLQTKYLRFTPPYVIYNHQIEGALIGSLHYGVSLFRIDGVWYTAEYPTVAQEAAADVFYRGGHVAYLTQEEAEELEAEGYTVVTEYR